MNYVHSEVVMNNRLSEAHVDSWRERGFALVHDLLPAALLHELKDDAEAFYPEPDTDAATHFHDFGSGQKFVFPAESNACNSVTLHPLLLQAVGDLLGVETTQLRLTQSDLWPKYGLGESAHALDNTDQRIHCDYPNHSLVHPPEWHRPEAVEIIIYLNDFDECDGATAVVPRQGEMTRPILGQSSTRQEWRGWTMSMTVLGPKLTWCSTTLRRQHFATTIFTLEKWSQGISSEVCCSIATILGTEGDRLNLARGD